MAAEDSDRKATWQTRAAIMGLLALLAIGGMSQLLMSISAAMSPPFGRLLVDDTDGLKTAFFGGAPHFVMCHNGAIADRNAGDAMQLFTQAAGTLGDAVTAVTLDCWEPLPSSGVTTLERFKLQPEEPAAKKKGKKKRKQTGKDKAPLAFTVANGRPPQQLPAVLFHKGAAVAPLVKAVTKNTRVKLVAASTTSHLTACIKAAPRPCVVLLAGPAALTNPSAKLSQWLAPVMEHHRKYQFAVVNASSRYLPEVRKALLAAGSGAAYADADTDKELLTGMVVLQKVKVPVQEKPKKKGKKKADKKKKGKTGKKTGKRSKDEDEDIVDADKVCVCACAHLPFSPSAWVVFDCLRHSSQSACRLAEHSQTGHQSHRHSHGRGRPRRLCDPRSCRGAACGGGRSCRHRGGRRQKAAGVVCGGGPQGAHRPACQK